MEGEEAAWEDLEEIYIPAANEGRLPLRLYSFVPLTTWCVGWGSLAGWGWEAGRPGWFPSCWHCRVPIMPTQGALSQTCSCAHACITSCPVRT